MHTCLYRSSICITILWSRLGYYYTWRWRGGKYSEISNNSPNTIPDYLLTSIKGSPDHNRYENWLKTQYKQLLFEYNIKHRISRAIND